MILITSGECIVSLKFIGSMIDSIIEVTIFANYKVTIPSLNKYLNSTLRQSLTISICWILRMYKSLASKLVSII